VIEAVTFDFWATLYRDSPEAIDRRRGLRIDYARNFFLDRDRPVTVEQLTFAERVLARQMAAMRDHHNAGVDAAEMGRRLGRIVGVQLDAGDSLKLGELISWAGREEPPDIYEGARELLEALHGKVKLGIISDSGLTLGVDMYAIMEADGIVGLFDHFTFSDQTGTTKPMVRQFSHTLHRLGGRPEQAVHVGDLEQTDVLGARRMGMRVIRILHPWEDPQSAADATVDRLTEVADVLRQWGLDV